MGNGNDKEPTGSPAEREEQAPARGQDELAEDTPDARLDTQIDLNYGLMGVSPAFAMASLYQTSGQTVGIGMQNAVFAQGLQYAINSAVVLQYLSRFGESMGDPKALEGLEQFVKGLRSQAASADPPSVS
ncbi:hypothetical protein PPSIR1_06451 [Plesiocystis pacifica SIR-1]|uniref:Uncharacterized protein n=1 Tax=Plesiocystis pacifica SIR-1 TaxID=391625 RepID=A6GI00_9BACT|nr:RebB family R body protein [Plesiocystis pacifica]EDM74507.1 hypothetical protein PPSIR1_06451 [Plesiocystis pacifica SIR-1]